MDSYCLLQQELGPAPAIGDLEAAADATTGISRLDCLNIYRDAHGVVVAGLSHDDAIAFQAVLAARGNPTRVVADADMPVLHESYQIQRIDHHGRELVLASSMGRVWTRPLADLVFLGAAFYSKIEFKQSWDLRIDTAYDREPKVVPVRKAWEESTQAFRLDLFFSTEPNRLHVALTPESAIFHQGGRLRLRDLPGLAAFMAEMAALLPPGRLNSQLREPNRAIPFRGPHLYENELRWHFERFASGTA